MLSSCVSFPRSSDHLVLTKSTINSIEGNFKNIPISKLNYRDNKDTSYFFDGRFSKELNRNMLNETLINDSTSSFELKVLPNQSLQINYLKENGNIYSQEIPFKLKKDGFLYLKNENLKPILVPFIVGAIDLKKVRISKNLSGQLISDVYNHRSGALLLIAFLNFTTTERRYIYENSK